MGGWGSGPGRFLIPVESCLCLSVGKLQRERKICPDSESWGGVSRAYQSGEPIASVGYEVETRRQAGYDFGSMLLRYKWQGKPIEIRVPLMSWPMPWGGPRWGFRCPVCNRACRKIYLPPGDNRFACRICHRLTYRSCRESHKYDAMFRRMGLTEKEALRIFAPDRPSRRNQSRELTR